MDKKKQIKFNLNNFLLAMSTALDSVEKDIDDVKEGHSKRVAYIALLLAKEFNYEAKGLFDVCAYSFMHNIALKQTGRVSKEYCEVGQELANKLPFLTNEENIIKYHCEAFNGSGFFGLKSESIPLFSQFINVADTLDREFDLSNKCIDNRQKIINFMQENENRLFSTDMVECLIEFSQKSSFWLDLQNENALMNVIFSNLQDFSIEPTFEEVLELSFIFMTLVDEASKMADYYSFEHKDKETFKIAASLCQIGKLCIPDRIISKQETLSQNEYEVMKAYPYYTKVILNNILGFNDICSWASTLQERIDGSGYPFKKEANELSLKHRLLASLVVFESLVSPQPYRNAFEKEEAITLMLEDSSLDKTIINDIKACLV